ncbi:MAG: hypothetical protein WDN03_09690 [Rhizomicrobium sp.]
MNKIPVGQTIRFAYAFTFGEIGTVLGLTWIPTLASTIVGYFAARSYLAMADSLQSGTPPPDAQALLPLPLAVLSLFLAAMIGVALVRQVLGLRKGPAIAHFALGMEELRVFAGFVGVYLALILFLFALAAVVAGFAALGGATPLAAGITAFAVFAGFLLVIYALVRLGYLLVPAAVADGHFGLSQSWQLTGGNFWRIVAVLLATLLPLMVVLVIGEAIIMGPAPAPASAPPADVAGLLRAWTDQMHTMQPHLPALMGLNLVLAPLGYSLLFAPAAFVYRVLSGKAIVAPHD